MATKTTDQQLAEIAERARIRDYPWHRDGEPCLRAMTTADCIENHLYGRTFAAASGHEGPEVVVLARGEVHADDERVEVLDLDHVLGMTSRSEYTAEDIAGIVAKLRRAGWESIADDVEEAYADAEPEVAPRYSADDMAWLRVCIVDAGIDPADVDMPAVMDEAFEEWTDMADGETGYVQLDTVDLDESIARHTFDRTSSGSVNYYIETGRYLTHAEVAEHEALNARD